MFLLLRVAFLVGLIFWLSPLRPGREPERENARLSQAETPGADLERVRRLVEAFDALSRQEREKAAETLRIVRAKMAAAAAEAARLPAADDAIPSPAAGR